MQRQEYFVKQGNPKRFLLNLVSLLLVGLSVMRAVAAAEDFTIVVLSDTQYYSCGADCHSSSAIFETQTQWIIDNKPYSCKKMIQKGDACAGKPLQRHI